MKSSMFELGLIFAFGQLLFVRPGHMQYNAVLKQTKAKGQANSSFGVWHFAKYPCIVARLAQQWLKESGIIYIIKSYNPRQKPWHTWIR